ncbi:MAG: YhcB family protein [Neptuniibacter sp.]
MENLWLISVAALFVGAVIGYLMGRSGGSNNQAEIAAQLEDTKKELEEYKEEVTAHFEKTSELVNDLTNSYKDVHEHLATGAQGLCQPGAIDIALEPVMQPKLTEAPAEESEPSDASEETPEPPRDYAPKSPDEEGMLSETFGLKDKDEPEEQLDPIASAAMNKQEKETA